ncbi:hypothetical protein [Paenibacillus paeoniae]|uniref:Uncharacterized protein n=1 Tax=Paenibacillus paeoniae TaxID=2292705 RepID=A0A371PKU6_9BACL|nr:hypothetical protein [Paenibacillus paeoniae]REK76387.1 hypothetical protein DX130_04915 [Paenibacillus paeoniae]
MSDEKRDIQELKQQLNAFEHQVQSLKNTNQKRSTAKTVFVAFLIVLIIIVGSIGVINYILF